MNWSKASALAEIVSSIAILATLVYLAIQTQQAATQTRQNSAAIIANSRQQALNAELQVLRMIVDYPVIAYAQPSASGDDGRRQVAADSALVRIRESQWMQFQDGQLDTDTWNAYLTVFIQQIRNRRLGDQWATYQGLGLNPGFVAAVNKELAQ